MLKREENQPEQAASEMRVKKEEMARAISILEARRQAEAQAQEGTVVIGDVLQQLQINVPAEEVLEEIEALREGQPQEEVLEHPVDPLRIKDAKLIAGIILVPLTAVVLGGLILNPFRAAPPVATTNPNVPGRQFPLWLPPPPVMSRLMPPGVTGAEMDEGGFNASSVLKPLSAVPDEQVVHCNSDSLRRLLTAPANLQPPQPDYRHRLSVNVPFVFTYRNLDAKTVAQSDQKFDVRPGLQKPWQIIKHTGSLYVRGWIAAKFTDAQAQEQPVTLHADPHSFDAGVTPQQITLKANFSPIYDMMWAQGPRVPAAELSVRNATLDSHAWEKW